MKIELTKHTNKNGETFVVGYTMVAENQQEKSIVNTIRNMNFWGNPVYNGRFGGNDSDNAGTLMWAEKKYTTMEYRFDKKTNTINERTNEE
jgi:hypothetical protein